MSWKITLLLLIFISINTYSQQDTIEVFLIDSFVTPEEPHTFIVSFFTSEPAKSSIVIDNTYEYEISEEFTDQHKKEIIVEDLSFSKKSIPFIIIVEDSLGTKNTSELYEFEMPYEISVEGGSNLFTLCLFGGTIFLLPSPVFVYTEEKNYFSLTKEIPIIFLRSSGIGYPEGYFSIEYSHLFNAPHKNLFRYGYKHIIEIPGVEYISPGVNGFTNFKGFNGISPEISVGLFRMYNVFTLFTRYRYNTKPGEQGSEFHELSIGLYSGFFAIYL
jgi:hypothetical protein